MMAFFIGKQIISGDRTILTYAEISQSDLEKKITEQLITLGYAHKGNGLFVKGSRAKRLLLGAFHKYFKFQISINTTDPQKIQLIIFKESSGISGGIMGMSQAKNEWEKVNMLLQTI